MKQLSILENENEHLAILALENSVKQSESSHLDAWLALAVSYANENNTDGVKKSLFNWMQKHPDYVVSDPKDITASLIGAARSRPADVDADALACAVSNCGGDCAGVGALVAVAACWSLASAICAARLETDSAASSVRPSEVLLSCADTWTCPILLWASCIEFTACSAEL